MGQHVLPGTPPVELTLRRSGRARRISLRVSGVDGRVTLTVPRHISEKAGLSFAAEKADWLRNQLGRQPEQEFVGFGTELPIEGQFLKVIRAKTRQIEPTQTHLYVPGPEERVAARVQGWLKVRARDRLVTASDKYARALGHSYARISLRDTRSRWGSCTTDRRLMYSWRLILAPPDVLDYVAAHEVSHLVEMNHSANFWSTVKQISPDYETPRRWLRENGASLHRFQFSHVDGN